MQIRRLGNLEAERPFVLDSDVAYDLESLTSEIDGAFLSDDGLNRVRIALSEGLIPEADVAELRIGSPIAKPGKIVCIGLNYRDHAAETGAAVAAEPVVFMKPPIPTAVFVIRNIRSRTGEISADSWSIRRRGRPATLPLT